MVKRTGALVRIDTSEAASALSKEQKAFNRWTKKIEQQRQLLQRWQTLLPVYQTRLATELAPLEQAFDERRADMARLLDRACESPGLTKTEKSKLPAFICSLLLDVMEGLDDPDLVALYDKHSDVSFEETQRQATEQARAMAEQLFGLDLGEGEPLDTPEALMRRVEEKLQQQQAEDESLREQAPPEPRRKPGAKALARQARLQQEAEQAGRSVREVYRQLASALHPDREPDPVERARKTELMQRVNAAYDAQNLLQLFELQLQIEQIDADHIGRIDDRRLKHYNQVLAQQSAQLQQELDEIQMAVTEPGPFGGMHRIEPERLAESLEFDLMDLKSKIADIEEDLHAFRHPLHLKDWLRGLRVPKAARRAPKAAAVPPAAPAAEPDPLQSSLF